MSTQFRLVAGAFTVVLALAPLGAQAPKKPASPKTEATMKADPPKPGAQEAGFKPLFDGKTLHGWRGYKKPDTSGTFWKVENGIVTLPASKAGDTRGAKDIISDATYDQFDLKWDWKIAEGGNSGVKYFVMEDESSAIGHEYQMIDDERHPDAKIGPHRQTAALYDVFPAHDRPIKPAGEWNTSEVIVKGNHVTHRLNGKTVLEYDLNSPELKAAVAKSKFKDIARFGTPQKGHILIQDHGDQVWYRNVRIKPLS